MARQPLPESHIELAGVPDMHHATNPVQATQLMVNSKEFNPVIWADGDVERLTNLLQAILQEKPVIIKGTIAHLEQLIKEICSYVESVQRPLGKKKVSSCLDQGLKLILHVVGNDLATPPKPMMALFDSWLKKACELDEDDKSPLHSINKHSRDFLSPWDRIVNWLRSIIFRCKDLRQTRMQMMKDAIDPSKTQSSSTSPAVAVSTGNGDMVGKPENPVPAMPAKKAASTARSVSLDVDSGLYTKKHPNDAQERGCTVW
jgi:hypothetical protein